MRRKVRCPPASQAPVSTTSRSSRRLLGGIPPALLSVCALVVVVVVAPVAVTIVQALQGGLHAATNSINATSPRTLLLHTVLVSLIATPLCGVIGVTCAWFVERTRLPGRRLWALLVVAPIAMPLFVTSYAWAAISPSLQGLLGAAGIISFSYYPIVFLLVAVSLRGMDPALEETARSLGLGAKRTFFRVVLPQLRPALLGGLLLVVLDTLVEFDAFVGLKYQTFAIHVYSQYQLSFSASGAAALSFFSIVLCVILLFGEARLRSNANYTRVSQAARRPVIRYRLGRTTPLVLAGFALVVGVGMGIPVGDADPLVHAEQPRRARGCRGEPALPLAGHAHLRRAGRRLRGARGPLRPARGLPRRSPQGPDRDGARACDIPLVRAPRPGRCDRARPTLRSTGCALSMRASR